MHLKVSSVVLAVSLVAGALCGAAQAAEDAPSYSIEDVTACSADAMRLCRSRMPDINAIEDCMREHYEQLRPKCKARFNK